jgi:hypothetical protein
MHVMQKQLFQGVVNELLMTKHQWLQTIHPFRAPFRLPSSEWAGSRRALFEQLYINMLWRQGPMVLGPRSM